jgi:trimethylamine--corrinoid protein Co-methyltransferase
MTHLSPRITWFSEDTRKKIVDEAVSILEQTGIIVENENALALLDGAGARVDGGRVHIPANLVEAAVASAPGTIRLYDRHGQVAMDLGDDRIHFNPGSVALRVFDLELGDARPAVTQDLVNFVTLTDALPGYAAQSTGLLSGDVPKEVEDRYRLFIGLQHSAKPVVTGTFQIEAFATMHKMLSAVAGGEEQLREKPMAIFDCCPSPPLKWSKLTCQALMDCAKTGVPAELISMPLAGATAPVTLAGSVTQHCAESLSGVVIHQLARAGSPIIYGGAPAIFDMRNGTTPMGAVETMMIDGAYAEIGKHLDLPTQAYMALSDSKCVDFQAGMETAMGAIIAALSGVNNISGPGILDFIMCQSLEKLVLDNELCGMAMRVAAGITVRDDPIAQPIIEESLATNEFLSLIHTFKWFREEAYIPDKIIDRGSVEGWRKEGKKDALARASARVKEILSSHTPEPLEEDVGTYLKELMESEARRYGMDQLPGALGPA